MTFPSSLLLAGAILAGLLLFLIRQYATQQRILARIARTLSASKDGDGMAATYQGTNYRYVYFAGSRYRASEFRVAITAKSSGSFQVVTETFFDKISKKMGWVREIQTGDPAFDEMCYLISDDAAFTSAFFHAPEKRQAVRALFQLGCSKITYDGKSFEATQSPFQLKESFDPAMVTSTVASLSNLAKELPVVAQPTGVQPAESNRVRRAIRALPLVLLFGGIVLNAHTSQWSPPLDQQQLFFDSLKYSLTALALFLGLLVRMGGQSSPHRQIASVLGLSIMGFVFFGNAAEAFLNGWLDHSQGTLHAAKAVNRYTRSGRGGRSYYVQVASWRVPGTTETLQVSSVLYRAMVSQQTTMRVLTKPGACHFEWVASMAPNPGEIPPIAGPSLADQLTQARRLQREGRADEAIEKSLAVFQYAEDEAIIHQAETLLVELGVEMRAPTPAAPDSPSAEIVVIPIGAINRVLLTEAISDAEAKTGIRYRLLADGEQPGPVDRTTWRGERQVNIERLMKEVQAQCQMMPQGTQGCLGVTAVDVFSQGLNFVFGMGLPGYGVMSYYRFLAATNGEPQNRPVLRERVVKQVVSTSFFILGIPRCTSSMCIRAYPNSLNEHDQKGTELCDWCKQQLLIRLHRDSL